MKSRLAFAVAVFCIIQYLGNIGPHPRLACAQVARIEIHSLKTITLTDEQFLAGVKDGKQDVIGGKLRIPRPGKDRLPAIVQIVEII